MYEYKAKIIRILSPVHFELNIDLGFNNIITEKIRLFSPPEFITKLDKEQYDCIMNKIRNSFINKNVLVQVIKNKYYYGNIFIDEKNISDMITEIYNSLYNIPEEIENIKKILIYNKRPLCVYDKKISLDDDPDEESDVFVISRFAVKLNYNGGKKPKSDDSLYGSDRWFYKRYNLFKNICYPSVMSQTDKNFRYIVISTEGILTKEQQDILEKLENIIFMYLPPVENDLVCEVGDMTMISNYLRDSFLNGELRKYINKEYVTTFRLDSDDCINKDFIKANRILLKDEKDNTLSSLLGGADFLYNENKYRLTKYHTELHLIGTPFIGLKEKISNRMKTVYERVHGGMVNNRITVSSKDLYLPWFRTIHDNNISNTDFTQGREIDHSIIKKYFDINI